LIWSYNKLYRHGSHHRALIQIERDSKYPDMWRVVRPDGSLTDIVNMTRAKDAAMSLALRALDAPVVAKIRGKTSPLEARPCVSTRKALREITGACGGPARTD
jgi:hypothetical protein